MNRLSFTPLPHEKALDILQMEAKGGQLDAELLGVFISAEVPKKALAPKP